MFISIITIGFIIAGAVLYYFLDSFVTREKEQTLKISANQISVILVKYLENMQDTISESISRIYLNNALEAFSNYTNSLIWVVDRSGKVVFSYPVLPSSVSGAKSNTDTTFKLKDKKQYDKVFNSDEKQIEEIGDFYGFFSNNYFSDAGNSWLTIETPVSLNDSGKLQRVAAIYLHSPVPEIQRARTSVFTFYLFGVLISIIISIILVYIFSRKLTKPILEINEAAKVIAGGDFNKRLNVRSSDEIGQLAGSFNMMVTGLQNLEEMRRAFVANVSHELRTPMTSIKGFVEGIIDGTIPPHKHSEYLTVVRDEATRLSRLVNNLLDLSKFESGEHKINISSFDINELIRLSLISLESQITDKNLHVEVEFCSENLIVFADRDEIRRVLINIIHNAIKFTPEKGSIFIGVEEDKDLATIFIEDTGMGISEDEKTLIWDRFYKADKSRGQDKTGTGLGLAIVKNIINEHEQKIWIESEEGKGTRFSFTLKLAKER
jgi:signal transduction histidine kinase